MRLTKKKSDVPFFNKLILSLNGKNKMHFGNMAKTLHASHINHIHSKSTFNRL